MKELLDLRQEVFYVNHFLKAYEEGKFTWEETLFQMAVALARENRLYQKSQQVRHKLEELQRIEEEREQTRVGFIADSLN